MVINSKLVVVSGVIIFIIGFVAGFLVAVDKSFDTGYKIAYQEIRLLLEEGYNGSKDFYISGLPYRFRPQADRKAVQVWRNDGRTNK